MQQPNNTPRSQAIVLGGSMAGLLAARVLLDHFDQVTIVERDPLNDAGEPRKSVPQGRHNHVLLGRGAAILSQLFPDITSELVAAGAVEVDLVSDLRWYQFGGYKIRRDASLPALIQSRPLLEQIVRRRLLALPGVIYRANCDVIAPLTTADHTRITGVQVRERVGDRVEEMLLAELVVDATGRGSSTPKWLAALGYSRPEETQVKIDVGYASRIYRRKPEEMADAKLFVTYPTPPDDKRMASLFPIEGERWSVTLGGWLGDHPPTDEQEFLAFARSLAAPDIYQVISRAEPCSEIAIHKFPASLRRRYEKLTRFPAGYLAMGDAVCSFNPIYGQGMTSAAMQAITLNNCLGELRNDREGPALWQRFFKQVARVIDVPWMLATGEDFRYPAVEGKRPLGTALVNWYTAKVHQVVQYDAVVYGAFLEVMNLNAPPALLFRPDLVWRVLRGKAPQQPTAQWQSQAVA